MRSATVADALTSDAIVDRENLQIILVTLFHRQVDDGAGSVALGGACIDLIVGILRRDVLQGHLKLVAVGLAGGGSGEGNIQLTGIGSLGQQAGGGSGFLDGNAGDLILIIVSNGRGITLGAVDAHGAKLQLHYGTGGEAVLDVQDVAVDTAQIDAAAIGHLAVEVVLNDLGVIRHIPADDQLAVDIGVVQGEAGGSGRLMASVGNGQIADVDLVLLGGTIKHQGDGGDLTSCVIGQIHDRSSPVAGSGGIVQSQDHGVLGIILEGKGQLHDRVIGRDLLKGDGSGGVRLNLQIGLVQMHGIGTGQIAVNDQGAAAVVGAGLGVLHFLFGAIHIQIDQSGAVVKIRGELGFIGAFKPPLPGGHHFLDVDVGPLFILADLTVHKVLHTVTGVEVGVESGAVDDGAFGDEVRHADPAAGIADVHIRTGVTALHAGVGGILIDAGPEHSLPLLAHPLIAVLLRGGTVIAIGGGVDALQAPVVIVGTAEQSVACPGIAILVIEFGQVTGTAVTAAEAGLIALDAVENGLIGVSPDGLGVGELAVNVAEAAVVDENGVVDLAVLLVEQPLGLGAVEGRVGIIPLGPKTGSGQVGHEVLEFSLPAALLLVHEVAVVTVVMGHFNELIGDVLPVVIAHQILAGLGRTERGVKIDTSDAHDAVLVGGIGIGGVGNVDNAELEATGLPVTGLGIIQRLGRVGGGGAMPGAEVIGILPEGHDILGELIGVHGASEEAVAIVAGHVHDLGIRGQIGLRLGGGEGLIAVLQRHGGHQEFGIGVCLRIPILNVLNTVARKGGLGGGRVIRPGICFHCRNHSRNDGNQHCHCQQKGSYSFELPVFHLFLLS